MPGFLYKEEPVNIPVYQHPLDLMAKALLTKDAKVKESLSMIKTQYDDLLDTPMTNEYNRMGVRNETEKAMNTLKGLSGADLSLPENQGAALGVFDNVLNNKNFLEDIAFTRHMSRQRQIVDDIKRKNPEQWAPQNEDVLNTAENEYRYADPSKKAPRFVAYTPYKDIDKIYKAAADSVPEDETYVEDGQPGFNRQTAKIDGYGNLASTYEVKQKRAEKIQQRFQAMMQQDPSIAQQMDINYDYLKKTGVITPEYVLSSFQNKLDYVKDQLKNPETTPAARDRGNDIIKDLEGKIKEIKINPDAAFETYGVGNWVNDYSEQMANSLASNKVGKREYDPASMEMFKSQLRMQEKASELGLQFKYKQAEGLIGNATDPNSWPGNEAIQLYNKLDKDGYLSVGSEHPLVGSLLGSHKNNDGSYDMVRLYGKDGNPSNTPIVLNGSADLNSDEMGKMALGLTLDNMTQDFKKVDPKLFTAVDTIGGGDYYDASTGQTRRAPYSTQERTMTEAEKVDKMISILSSNDPKYKGLIEKYKEPLQKMGIDPNNGPQAISKLNDMKSFLANPENAQKINIGVTLSGLQGRFKFTPSGDGKTVQVGDNGTAYVRGIVEVPKDQLSQETRDALDKNNLGVVSVIKKADSDDPKKERTYYTFEAKLPTNVDMVEAGLDYLRKSGETDPKKLSYAREQLNSYTQNLASDQTFSKYKDEHGNPYFYLAPNAEERDKFDKILYRMEDAKNNGELSMPQYKELRQNIMKLKESKFATKAEGKQALDNMMKYIPPELQPEVQGEVDMKKIMSDVQGALRDPNLNKLIGTLKSQGFSDYAAALWAGNFMQESSLKPSAVNNLGNFGLAQWGGSRKSDLEKFAREKGTEPSDFDTQVEFFLKELKDRKVFDKATSEDKSDVVNAIRGYEQYKHWDNPGAPGDETGERFYYGNQLYQLLSGQ